MPYKFLRKIFTLFLLALFALPSWSLFPNQRMAAEWGSKERAGREFVNMLPFPLPLLFSFRTQLQGWGLKMLEKNSLPRIDLAAYLPETLLQLELWLPGYSASVYEKEVAALNRSFPQLSIAITSFGDEATYFSELQKAFVRGEAPDLFLVNHSWFQELRKDDDLVPAATELVHPNRLTPFFYPLATEFFNDGQVWAAPLFGKFPVMISNAALLRDERIFVAGRPGQTWTELFSNFQKYREYGDSKIMPIALGHPVFSPRTFDVFLLLLEQAGIADLAEKGASDALSFLLGFATPYQGRLNGQEEALFLRSKIAVLFGDEAMVQRLKTAIEAVARPPQDLLKEANLTLDLLPQFRAGEKETIGEIWGFAVAKSSSVPEPAWALALYFSGMEQARAHFLKTRYTPLIRGLTSDIFAASAAAAGSGGSWRNLDFETLWRENVLAHFPEDRKETAPAVSDTLRKFADFFAADEER